MCLKKNQKKSTKSLKGIKFLKNQTNPYFFLQPNPPPKLLILSNMRNNPLRQSFLYHFADISARKKKGFHTTYFYNKKAVQKCKVIFFGILSVLARKELKFICFKKTFKAKKYITKNKIKLKRNNHMEPAKYIH